MKGSITVYLSLVLLLMLSFVTVILEGARINAMKLRAEQVTMMALDSAFAEYHRGLFQDYDLLLIDMSYGNTWNKTEEGQTNRVAEHIRSYMNSNFSPARAFIGYRDWYALTAGMVSVTDVVTAADHEGMVLKRQAVSYMKDLIGLDSLSAWKEQISESKSYRLNEKDIDQELEEVQKQINETELPLEESEPGKYQKIPVNNPADSVNRIRGKGILSLVVDHMENISQKSVDLAENLTGRRLSEKEDNSAVSSGSAEDELFFGEYILQKCGSYLSPKEKGSLSYQVEYLLEGKNTDSENLKSLVNRMIAFREAANVIALLRDQTKLSQADAAAAVLSAVIRVPQLKPLIKATMIFAWSYAESVNDCKILLSGGRIPLIKQAGEWKFSLDQAFSFQKGLQQTTDSKSSSSGLNYRDYLRIFLFLENRKEKLNRFMDIVELDMCLQAGNNNFRLTNCIEKLDAYIEITSKFGRQWTLKRKYSYFPIQEEENGGDE